MVVDSRELREESGEGSARKDGELLDLRIDSIVFDPENARKSFDAVKLAELGASIAGIGLIEPIVVREIGDGTDRTDRTYRLIAGERRVRAAQMTPGITHLPALVLAVDDETAVQMGLVENLQREDLNPIDEARAYRRLVGMGWTQQRIATEILGRENAGPTVSNKLRLLDLPPSAQNLVVDGVLSGSAARALVSYVAWPKLFGEMLLLAKSGVPSKTLESVPFDVAVRVEAARAGRVQGSYVGTKCDSCDRMRRTNRASLLCLDVECYERTRMERKLDNVARVDEIVGAAAGESREQRAEDRELPAGTLTANQERTVRGWIHTSVDDARESITRSTDIVCLKVALAIERQGQNRVSLAGVIECRIRALGSEVPEAGETRTSPTEANGSDPAAQGCAVQPAQPEEPAPIGSVWIWTGQRDWGREEAMEVVGCGRDGFAELKMIYTDIPTRQAKVGEPSASQMGEQFYEVHERWPGTAEEYLKAKADQELALRGHEALEVGDGTDTTDRTDEERVQAENEFIQIFLSTSLFALLDVLLDRDPDISTLSIFERGLRCAADDEGLCQCEACGGWKPTDKCESGEEGIYICSDCIAEAQEDATQSKEAASPIEGIGPLPVVVCVWRKADHDDVRVVESATGASLYLDNGKGDIEGISPTVFKRDWEVVPDVRYVVGDRLPELVYLVRPLDECYTIMKIEGDGAMDGVGEPALCEYSETHANRGLAQLALEKLACQGGYFALP